MTRHVKRGGKVWIRVFPDKPVTQKPAETRMGSGKGNPEHWVAVVRPGRVLFELAGVERDLAEAAMERAIQKLPLQGPLRRASRHPRCARGAGLMASASELRRAWTTEELESRLERVPPRAVQPALPAGHRPAGQHRPHAHRPQGRRPDPDGPARPRDRRGRGPGRRRRAGRTSRSSPPHRDARSKRPGREGPAPRAKAAEAEVEAGAAEGESGPTRPTTRRRSP